MKNRGTKLSRFLIPLAVIFIAGCGPSVYYEIPADLRSPEVQKNFIARYSPAIKEKIIFLDPGHGGEDRKNRGEHAVEADVNLRVALYLRDFLEQAGAHVIMSRVTDQTVPLKERTELANNSSADIFLSIHHNAPPGEGDNWTNYTSTYYHAYESDFEYEPCERILARYIQRDLSYAMRNPGGPGSFDGTYSDYSVYPGQGFAVLRMTDMPSVLVECGFHTHNHEGKRITIEEFNRIQAWGIFRGLCRFFYSGIPEIRMLDSVIVKDDTVSTFNFVLEDSASIDSSTIIVQLDSLSFSNWSFNRHTGILSADPENLSPGNHYIRIIASNRKGNYAFPFHKQITIIE